MAKKSNKKKQSTSSQKLTLTEKLTEKFIKLTPAEREEQQRAYNSAFARAEFLWQKKDKEPWSKPQFTKPIGVKRLGFDEDYSDKTREKAASDEKEACEMFHEKLEPVGNLPQSMAVINTPKGLTDDDLKEMLDSVEKELKVSVEKELEKSDSVDDPEVLKPRIYPQVEDPNLKKFNAAVEKCQDHFYNIAPPHSKEEISALFEKPTPKVYTLTTEDLEKVVAETQKNLSEMQPPPLFSNYTEKAGLWTRFCNWFMG